MITFLNVCACVATALAGLSLAHRQLGSPDLGYHLAYGESLLDGRGLVSGPALVHPALSASTASADDLPPGAWYAQDGSFRFPNANWLSQLVMAALHRRGGLAALGALQVALVAIILAAQAGAMRRWGLPWLAVAAVWLATALGAYERFSLRPEVFAYACLAVQLWLLAGRITWPRLAGVLLVQVAAVNFHSYWMLAMVPIAALAGDAWARLAWQRRAKPRVPADPHLRRRAVRLVAGAAMLLPAALANPFGWRGALLPVQTLLFLRRHGIAGMAPEDLLNAAGRRVHPWALIGEFSTPWLGRMIPTAATAAYVALLALSVPAGLWLLARRRAWAVATLAAFLAVSTSMRRNIAVAAVVLWPIVALGLSLLLAWARARPALSQAPPWTRRLRPAAAATLTLLGLTLAALTASNTLYRWERRDLRFGSGLNRLWLPIGAARWLDEHLPHDQPVFTDYNSSSSLVYFSRRTSAVPLLTNTWAYPPTRMAEVLALSLGQADVDATLAAWDMDVVVLQTWPACQVLTRRLSQSPEWALVHLEGAWAVFLRRTQPNAPLIGAHELRPERFDTQAYLLRCRRLDPVPLSGLKAAAGGLQTLGWLEPAMLAWQACIEEDRNQPELWYNLGACLANRGNQRLLRQDARGLADLRAARAHVQRALELRRDYPLARHTLELLSAQIQANER